jgi:hypothetical protein
VFKRFSQRIRREHQPTEPVTAAPPSQGAVDLAPSSPPGRFWAIGVLVLAALVSMSMNTWHAWNATSLPKPLAFLYGVAPVALAAMQSHAVALRALRKEKVGTFRRTLTFGLVLGGLGLSFLGIYDLLRHAVPDPIPAVPIHEPAVFFSIVIDLMALAALHELLRESPSFVSAVRAAETVTSATAEAVPEVSPADPETISLAHGRSLDVESSPNGEEDRQASGIPDVPSVPDPFAGVPPQVGKLPDAGKLSAEEVDAEPVFSDQVQLDEPIPADDPLYPLALREFLADVAQGEPPSVRTIKERMSVGTDRARRLRSYLGGLVEVSR